MCGRYVTSKSARQYARLLRAERTALPLPSLSWNVAPTSQSLVVRQDEAGTPREDVLVWGLEARTGTPSFFNAKVETADAKPSFRGAWKNRHMVVPIDGWYEWKLIAGQKQPYFFHRPDDAPLFLAGMWERRNFVLLTADADGLLAHYHHRRPVGLDVDAAQRWIEGGLTDWRELVDQAIPGDAFALHPVSRRVNRAGVDGPDLTDPVEIEHGPEQISLL